jgi:hypothetical protein
LAIALAGTVLAAYANREELCVQPEAGTRGSVSTASAEAPREAPQMMTADGAQANH